MTAALVDVRRGLRCFGLFEFGKSLAQCSGLVSADLTDEMYERCRSATRFRLLQCVDHQARHQFVTPRYGCVPVRAVVALLGHEILLRETL
jgi:hypothetical protein